MKDTGYIYEQNGGAALNRRPNEQQEQKKRLREPEIRERAPAARPKTQINFAAIGVFLVVAALMAVVVYNYMQLTELSVKKSSLTSQLEYEQNLAGSLALKAENKMTIAEIEEYAVSKLGMTKMSPFDVEYISVGGGDKTVIMSAGAEKPGGGSFFLSGISGGMQKLMDYFK